MAFTLAAQGVPALAASAQPAAAPSAVGDAPNRAADQFDIWSTLSPQAWDESLEEGCIENGGAACKMTAAQVAKLPSDIQKLTGQLRSEILANPQEQAELKADRQAQPRAFGGAAAKIVGTIAKFTKNPTVRKLADRADKLGDVAGHVTDATYAANGLTEGTAPAIAKSVVYMMPVVGDVYSLGEAIANGDVESGVVATVSLIGTAVGVAFPPAGAVVAVGLAVYYVAKLLFGWSAAEPRDWIAEPPGTPQEMTESGAFFHSEMYKVADKPVSVVLHTTGGQQAQVVQTLLLDSRWTDHNRDRRPVTYVLPAGGGKPLSLDTQWANDGATITAWQGGKRYDGTCTGQGIYSCGLAAPLTIALDRPAVMKITYTYSLDRMSLDYCTAGSPPCVPRAYVDDSARLRVLSESKQPVSLTYRFTYGIDR